MAAETISLTGLLGSSEFKLCPFWVCFLACVYAGFIYKFIFPLSFSRLLLWMKLAYMTGSHILLINRWPVSVSALLSSCHGYRPPETQCHSQDLPCAPWFSSPSAHVSWAGFHSSLQDSTPGSKEGCKPCLCLGHVKTNGFQKKVWETSRNVPTPSSFLLCPPSLFPPFLISFSLPLSIPDTFLLLHIDWLEQFI